MRKFKCTVTKTYDYEIEIDESQWDDEALKNWSSVFEDVEDLQELVEVLTCRMDGYYPGQFIEGFGRPNFKGKTTGSEKESNPSINIISVEESTDVESAECS